MSAVSKIPQNRPSRIAGPSKLPSRVLRPTFTNKNQPPIPNFVNSAKQIEKKKETASLHSGESTAFESNRNLKNPKQRTPQKTGYRSKHFDSNSLIDCNGNKSTFDGVNLASENQLSRERKGSVSSDKTQSPPKSDPNSTKNSRTDQNALSGSKGSPDKRAIYYNISGILHEEENITGSPAKMNNFSSERLPSTEAPTFRSIKPGYFLQKVNAIKSSQQRGYSEKTQASSALGKYKLANQESTGFSQTTFSLPPKSTSSTVQSSSLAKGRYGNKTENKIDSEDLPDSVKTSTATTVLQPSSRTIYTKSRMVQPSAGAPRATESSQGSYVSRAEKRKKYLEGKSSKGAVQINDAPIRADQIPQMNNQNIKQNDTTLCSNPNEVSQTSYSGLRRPGFGNRGARSAKIARPVIRPKATLSPTTAKPFAPNSNQLGRPKDQDVAEQLHPDVFPDTESERGVKLYQANVLKNSNLPAGSPMSNSRYSSNFPESDQHSVASAASEESGYSSVTSTVFLDNHVNTVKGNSPLPAKTAFKNKWSWKNNRPCRSETDATSPSKPIRQGQETRQVSQSLSDVPGTEDPLDSGEEQNTRYCTYIASKDIITYGQYRLQVEGHYAPEHRYGDEEGKQIRSSLGSDSSDSDFSPDMRTSPSVDDAEAENTSDSSVDTVIRKSRTPETPDTSNQSDTKDETDENEAVKSGDQKSSVSAHNEPVTNGKLEVTAETRSENERCASYKFTTAADETLFTTLRTPEPSKDREAITPASNSTSKAKKRKTDSVLMSPLYPENEIPGQDEIQKEDTPDESLNIGKQTLEKEIIFEVTEKDVEGESEDEDQNLSDFIDLPSLHESALMTDYNSVLEDDTQSEEEESELNTRIQNGCSSPSVHRQESITSMPSVQTTVINKLLSNGLDGIVRSHNHIPATMSEMTSLKSANLTRDEKLVNGYHCGDGLGLRKSGSPVKRYRQCNSVDDNSEDNDINISEILQEYRVMKISLQQVYRMLEADEEKTEKHMEEIKRLQMKNHKLNQTVDSLTHELETLRMSAAKPQSHNKEIQTGNVSMDASTSTDTESSAIESTKSSHEVQESGMQTAGDSSRWYHSEVSDKVQSDIKEATEEIKNLKTLRGDFDRRIQGAELRLNSALQWLHR